MTQDIRHHLRHHFRFGEPRFGQEQIRQRLGRESTAAVFPYPRGLSLEAAEKPGELLSGDRPRRARRPASAVPHAGLPR